MGYAWWYNCAQAIELYDGDPVEMELKEGDLYLFFFDLPEYTRDVYFDMYSWNWDWDDGFEEEDLLLRHTSLR